MLHLLDTRSFASLWYWLAFAAAWSFALRNIIGVPPEVVSHARRADPAGPDDEAAMTLLDWLSVILPHWRLADWDAAILAALGGFVLTGLAVLGFLYGLEAAQALSLLLIPLAVYALMRLRLARRLMAILSAAQRGEITPNAAARTAARAMIWHRWGAFLLSMLAVALTAIWGTLWMLTHPFGY